MGWGFDVYRAFAVDAEENRKWVEEHGKCRVPVLSLSGEKGFFGLLRGEADEGDV
jgi:hypothetical protein